MRKWLISLALTLAMAQLGWAQTPTFRIQWDQAEVASITQSYQYTLKVDSGTATLITPTCVVLTGVPGQNSRCTAPLPVLTSGQHVLVLTAFNGFGSASSDPLAGGPPSRPVNVTVIVIVA